MGTSLTGKNISATYLGLLKTTDNAVIGGTAKIITDGNGTDSPLYLSTTRLGIGITPTSTLHVNGDANINTLTVGLGNGSISTNTVFGNNALKQNTTGYMNTAIGVDALRNNTDGDNNIAIGRLNLDANTSGIRNVALGNQSLTSNTTGSYNVGLGYDGLSALSSGGYNIGIGYEAGNNITTGTGSIMIGGVTRSSGATSSNEIVIGYNTTGNGSNTVTIGNSSITTNHFSGDILLGNSENLFFGNTSDVYISGTTVSDNIQLGVGGSTQFTFSQASGLRLHQYGGGTITGTATQRLGVDSSGNVIEIPIGAGAVDGSGTANTVTMWSDSDTITDAPITISGNDSTFVGAISVEPTSGTAKISFTSQGAGSEVFSVNGQIPGVSNTGFAIRNETDSRNDLMIDGNGNATFAGSIIATDSSTSTIKILPTGGTTQFISRNSADDGYISHISDATQHIYKVSNSEKIRLDSSGRLGLGTTSPTSLFTIKASDNAYTGGINIIDADSSTKSGITHVNGSLFLSHNASTDDLVLSSGNATFAGGITTTSTSGIKIDTTGNAILEIDGASGSTEAMIFKHSGTEVSRISHSNSTNFVISTGSSVATALTIDSSQNATFAGDVTVQGGDLTIGTDSLAGNINSVGDVLAFDVDSNTGGASPNIQFKVSNSEKMRLDSSGNLGLGTTSPNSLLTIESASSPTIRIKDTTNNCEAFLYAQNSNAHVGTQSNHSFMIDTNNTTALTIDTSQNVGIGTSSPYTLLELSSTDPIIRMTDSNGVADKSIYEMRAIGASGFESLEFRTVNDANTSYNKLLVLKHGGNVGFGTDTPIYDVQIGKYGASGVGSADSTLALASATDGTGSIRFGDGTAGTDANAGKIVYDHSDNSMAFHTSASERARITSGGKVGISTTNAIMPLTIKGDVSRNAIAIFNSGTGTEEGILYWYSSDETTIRAGISGNENGLDFKTGSSATNRMRISSDGEIQVGNAVGGSDVDTGTRISATQMRQSNAGTGAHDFHDFYRGTEGSLTRVGNIRTTGTSTAYNTSSDYRLKENVVELTGALDRISQLKPSRFNFIADAETTVDGFLAHEVQDIVPEAISGEKDAVDEEGNAMYQGIDQSKLVPLLVASIQELKAEIDELKKNK